MKKVDLETITLYDLAKRRGEETPLIGDTVRHSYWERYAMEAAMKMMGVTSHRSMAQAVISMIKSKSINGEMLETIIKEMTSGEINPSEQEAIENLAAIKNML